MTPPTTSGRPFVERLASARTTTRNRTRRPRRRLATRARAEPMMLWHASVVWNRIAAHARVQRKRRAHRPPRSNADRSPNRGTSPPGHEGFPQFLWKTLSKTAVLLPRYSTFSECSSGLHYSGAGRDQPSTPRSTGRRLSADRPRLPRPRDYGQTRHERPAASRKTVL